MRVVGQAPQRPFYGLDLLPLGQEVVSEVMGLWEEDKCSPSPAPRGGKCWMAKACRGPVRTLAQASVGGQGRTGRGGGRMVAIRGWAFPPPWGTGWPPQSLGTPQLRPHRLQQRRMHVGQWLGQEWRLPGLGCCPRGRAPRLRPPEHAEGFISGPHLVDSRRQRSL